MLHSISTRPSDCFPGTTRSKSSKETSSYEKGAHMGGGDPVAGGGNRRRAGDEPRSWRTKPRMAFEDAVLAGLSFTDRNSRVALTHAQASAGTGDCAPRLSTIPLR